LVCGSAGSRAVIPPKHSFLEFPMTANLNGRPQRKQLSDQLDRLDTMIDCLSEALPQAVADATREGTRSAVRDILGELLRDPEILARLRDALGGGTPSKPSEPAASPPAPTSTSHGPGLLTRVGGGLQRGASAAVAKGRQAFATIRARVREAKDRAGAAIRTAQTIVPLGRFAATAAAVGVTVAAVSYVAPQGFSAVVSGVGGAIVAGAVQTYRWLRKSARSVGLLA
jgi:hypothetical protein